MLVCMNLPPDMRYKRRNVLFVGFVPGPNNPKDLDSFLFPLVQELLQLEKGLFNPQKTHQLAMALIIWIGVTVYNCHRKAEFILRAHICLVTGDMPGRAKLQCFKGNRASRYCSYCMAMAVHNGHSSYCPFMMPVDMRANATPRQDYNRLFLPLRSDEETREIARKVVDLGSSKLAVQYGVTKVAIISNLRSVDMIRSFPPDAMHLFWENIIPTLVRHWRGNFTTIPTMRESRLGGQDRGGRFVPHDEDHPMQDHGITAGAQEVPVDNEDSDESETRRSPPTKKRKSNAGGSHTIAGTSTRSSPEFIATEDPWNIHPAVWDRIGTDMQTSHATLPAQFGEAPRDFWQHCHHMKASEWKNLALIFLPIYLKDK